MEKDELLVKLQTLTQKEVTLSSLAESLDISKHEILGLISELREDGINILVKKHDDDIYLYNLGENDKNKENSKCFKTDENNEFKFVVISDTRIGSKSQQLSILNDIYEKAEKWVIKILFIVVILQKGYIQLIMIMLLLHF